MKHDLTPREQDVLLGLADGLTDPEIGRELFIAPSTVKYHVKHLQAKLGARNRTHVVALAYHRRILTPLAPRSKPKKGRPAAVSRAA